MNYVRGSDALVLNLDPKYAELQIQDALPDHVYEL